MGTDRRVTIQEVARKAGVSAGTVSRVLAGQLKENRPAIARRATRIRRIAENLGYRPNAAARSMLRGRFGQVAFVNCGTPGSDWFPRRMLHGIHEGLEMRDSHLLVNEMAAEQFEAGRETPSLLSQLSVDGLLVHMTPQLSANIISAFDSHPLSNVWLNMKRPNRAVYPDERGGGMLAARYLLERGRRRVAFLLFRDRSDPWRHYSDTDRPAGLEEGLRQSGGSMVLLDLDAKLLRGEENIAIARNVLENHSDCDAFVCYSALEATTLYAAALSLGHCIDDDLEIITFDELEVSARTGMFIPTVMIPFRQAGLKAIDLLWDMFEEPEEEKDSVTVSYEAVSR